MKRTILWLMMLVSSVALVGCALPSVSEDAVEALDAPTIVLSDEATAEADPDEEVTSTDEPALDPTEDPAEPTDEAESEEDALARAGCEGNNGTIPPHAETLAEEYEVTTEVVMDWFCQGYGFGEIKNVYELSQASGKSVAEIFAMREQGMGWGEIKKELGEKPGQGCNPNDEDCDKENGQGCNPHDEDCDKPGGPPEDRGNGNKKDKD